MRPDRQIAQARKVGGHADAERLPQRERDEHRNARVLADQPLRLLRHEPIVFRAAVGAPVFRDPASVSVHPLSVFSEIGQAAGR
ncbi:hypothetical protein D3C73_1592660 [compost metagenome]